MVELQNSADLIIAIKHAWNAKNLTIAQLQAILDEKKQTISRTTLNRVFATDSEINDTFNYTSTLKPLAEILLEEDDSNEYDQIIEDLRTDIRAKNEVIEKKCLEINSLKEQLSMAKTQVEIKDRRIDECNETIKRLMDRLDTKDEIIAQFLIDMKQKDDIIKYLGKGNVAAGK